MIGTYLHGPLLPKNAWFADWLIAAALGTEQPLAPLDDELEARRARRGPAGRGSRECAARASGLLRPDVRRRCSRWPWSRLRRQPRAARHHDDAPATRPERRQRSPGTGKPPVTIGDKNYTEQFVLGELYFQALQAQGFTVHAQPQHRPHRGHAPGAAERPAGDVPRVPVDLERDVAGYRRRVQTAFRAYQAGQRYALAHGLELLNVDAVQRHRRDRGHGRLRPRSTGSRSLARPAPGRAVADARRPAAVPAEPRGLPRSSRSTGSRRPRSSRSPSATSTRRSTTGTRPGRRRQHDRRRARRPATTGCSRDPAHVFGWGNVVPVASAKVLDAEGPAFARHDQPRQRAADAQTMRQLNAAVEVAQQEPATVARSS